MTLKSLDLCRQLIRSPAPARVAFQGELGANSHIACKEAFPDFEPIPCETFEDALAQVQEGHSPIAMIPIENTVAGRVADIHMLLPHSTLNIVGEYFLPIRHQLLGVRGAKIEDLTTVQSHVHAIGQCRKVIRSLGVKAVIGSDTAGSARQIAEGGDARVAAIASKLAAEVYDLDILREDIEDETHNTTRFVVLTKDGAWIKQGQGKTVTTFIFEVRNIPAALYKCLGGFATSGINMTKLESYQINGTFIAAQFFAEVEAHPEDPGLALALEEVKYFSERLHILGVYPASPNR